MIPSTYYDIIRYPVLTEKSMLAYQTSRQCTFKVDPMSNKVEIHKAVERLFKVKVDDVQTIRTKGKKKRVGKTLGKKADGKKAIVTLKPDQKIDIFEGV
ncbi:MAG: 50S ribosomal protein L23 [Deltaproteobacteria bacterium]|nr:50S ribosomal protein L23 [Deltaproteobacteria bacterium]